MRSIRSILVVALLTLAACGGDGGTTTTAAGGDEDATTTTAMAEATTTAATDEDDGGEEVSFDDIPRECMDAFIAFLQEIEPIVEPIDWDNATTEDLEEMGNAIEPIGTQYETTFEEAGCDDIRLEGTDEEQFEVMISIAEREAPGTVAYFEWIRDFATGSGDTPQASGDCQTDIAAMQAIVDEGGTMNQLPIADLQQVGTLMTSIAMECPPERSAEFFEKEDVAAFTGG